MKSETKGAVVYDVTQTRSMNFFDAEIEERITELEEYGPFAEKQAIPFVTHKQNIPIYIIMALCVIAHIWAWVTIE